MAIIETPTKEFDLLYQLLTSSKEYSFGWPENFDFNYQKLCPLLGFHINNVGQPFYDTHFKTTTRGFEREVIYFFSELYQLAFEDFYSGDDTGFGYVTSGGTEGNMYGIFLGRETYIVVFKRPSTEIIKKWSLAFQGNWAHVIVMQHITKEKIDHFFDELKLEIYSNVA